MKKWTNCSSEVVSVNKDLARQILNHYGIMHQKAKAIEELAELIVALQKDILAGKESHSRAVLEEIADVHLCLHSCLMTKATRRPCRL